LILAPPSYVVSPNRFTMPIVKTNAKAADAPVRIFFEAADVDE
jgi:hypothetical protein